MKKRVEALVKPELLKWARKSSGLSLDVVYKKSKVKKEKLEEWERGESAPSIAQLRKLANIYKRPIAIFYLSKIPKEFDALYDFRLLWGEEKKLISPSLRYEIRLAQYRRENILNLYKLNNELIPKIELSVKLYEDEDLLAEKIRNFIKIKIEDQFNWKNEYEAFNSWRNALFDSGILVFQAAKIYMQEMRGFSIYNSILPIIVVNNKDVIRGRIFSMIHELVHILLKKGGLCNLREAKSYASNNQRFEIFCNRVAGAVLVPKNVLLQEDIVIKKKTLSEWEDSEILYLSNKFKVSREAILRRLLIERKITNQFYEVKREQYIAQYKKRQLGKESHPQHHIIELSKTGHFYARFVLSSYYQDKITASELSDYLGVKLKHLPKIEAEIFDNSSSI